MFFKLCADVAALVFEKKKKRRVGGTTKWEGPQGTDAINVLRFLIIASDESGTAVAG